jgi:hypothetical protein
MWYANVIDAAFFSKSKIGIPNSSTSLGKRDAAKRDWVAGEFGFAVSASFILNNSRMMCVVFATFLLDSDWRN